MRPKKQISKITPLRLDAPTILTEWFEEPQLLFADGSMHCDPKVGIPLYGPRSLGTGRHKREIHVGFVGTAEGIAQAQEYYADCANGVDGDEDHAPFPGCSQDIGYRCDLRMDSNLVETITRRESLDVLDIRNSRERFEAMLGLLVSKVDLLSRKDYPLDYVAVVIPNDLYDKCRVVDYKLKGAGEVHRDLRRAFKVLPTM